MLDDEYIDIDEVNKVEPVTSKSEVVDLKSHLPAEPTQDPPPVPPRSQGSVYLARTSYDAKTSKGLSFKKGEKLMIIGSTEGDWWIGKSLIDGKQGYVNSSFVVPVTNYEDEE